MSQSKPNCEPLYRCNTEYNLQTEIFSVQNNEYWNPMSTCKTIFTDKLIQRMHKGSHTLNTDKNIFPVPKE